MKTEGQTRQKLKQVLYRHRKKMLQDSLRPLPCNCKHNKQVSLPSEFLAEYADVHVCGYQENGWRGVTCDDRIEGDLEKAILCDFFESKYDPEILKEQFQEFVDNATVAELAGRYPDAGALQWVLEEESEESINE